MAPIFSAVGLFVTPVVTVFRVAVSVEPTQKRANAAMRQCDTGIFPSLLLRAILENSFIGLSRSSQL
jgi:hypothetical protein